MNMEIKDFDNLVDLFFYESDKHKKDEIFLEWLKTTDRRKYSWRETIENIYKLSDVLKKQFKKKGKWHLCS